MSYQNDVLMNFRIPRGLKSDFETLCYSERTTMTHSINQYIRKLVLEGKKSNPELFESKNRKHKRPTRWSIEMNESWRQRLIS